MYRLRESLGWDVDAARVAALRAEGVAWKKIATELGVGTQYRLAVYGSKIRERVI